MKSSPAKTLTIGAVAQRLGLATHVLRHWETVGLLRPDRDVGDRRRYGPDDLFRVAVILQAKEAGFSLDEIREMMTSRPTRRREVMQHHRDDLIRRIQQATTALALLECALACSHTDVATCPHFREAVHQRIDHAEAVQLST